MGKPEVAVHSNGNGNGRLHTPIPVYGNSPTFQMACKQLENVAEYIDIDGGVLERLHTPRRAMVVAEPTPMEDGQTGVFTGLPGRQKLTTGPSQGAPRYPPNAP